MKQFLAEEVHATEEQKTELKSHLQLHLIPDSKLYVVTNPLVDSKDECEIEDLFAEEVQNINLDGKTFCRKDSFDNSKFFGKDIFSKYILENYKQIDFSRFIPLLNAIDSIIAQTQPTEK